VSKESNAIHSPFGTFVVFVVMPAEHAELLELGNQIEVHHAKRLTAVWELAQLWGCDFDEMMKLLGVERIISLRPDLVVVYATQKELVLRLERGGIPYFSYEHRGLPDIMTTVRAIGARIGSATRADAVASDMDRSLDRIRATTARVPHPATLLVFSRDPSSLRNVYASGGYGFLHDMLEIAGGTNVFGEIKRQSVQASTEMLITRRPDVIIELRYGDGLRHADVSKELQVWNVLGSVPAIRNHRVAALVGDEFVVPGPRVVDATRRLARALHPEVFR